MVSVPSVLFDGSLLYWVFGVTVPCWLNDSVAACAPTSCTPDWVKTCTWLLPELMTRISISCDSWLMY